MTITLNTGTYFAANPIILTANTSASDFPSGSSFGLVKVVINNLYTLTAEVPTTSTSSIVFDISSVARSLLNGLEPTAAVLTNPIVSLSVVAHVEYVLNGTIGTGTPTAAITISSVLGGYQDTDLIGKASSFAHTGAYSSCTFTRKPSRPQSAPELIRSGDSLLTTAPGASAPGSPVTTATPINSAGQYQGHYLYPSTDKNLRSFRFLNSFGVIENATAYMLESMSSKTTTEERTLSTVPSYPPSSDTILHKTAPRTSYKMSSGPVNRPWAIWFATEFLTAKRHWLYFPNISSGTYVPVLLTPDDDTLIYDRAEPDLLSIDFTLTLAIPGPLPLSV